VLKVDALPWADFPHKVGVHKRGQRSASRRYHRDYRAAGSPQGPLWGVPLFRLEQVVLGTVSTLLVSWLFAQVQKGLARR
jgi:hypothetical protein